MQCRGLNDFRVVLLSTFLITSGATNAMQDAVILANCLVELKDLKLNNIRFALEDFQEQRYRHARRQYLYSKMVSKLMTGQVR